MGALKAGAGASAVTGAATETGAAAIPTDPNSFAGAGADAGASAAWIGVTSGASANATGCPTSLLSTVTPISMATR